MENDDGVAVDLYVPRKWYVRKARGGDERVLMCSASFAFPAPSRTR